MSYRKPGETYTVYFTHERVLNGMGDMLRGTKRYFATSVQGMRSSGKVDVLEEINWPQKYVPKLSSNNE